MSTSEERPHPDEALARAQAARAKMAAALDKVREPGAAESLGWQPVWKRPRKPKSKAAKKAELRRQRGRLKAAERRRLAAGQSRRPRPGRTGSATRPRAGMPGPCPGCGTQAPGWGDDGRHRPLSGVHPTPRIATGYRTSSGLHSSGLHPMDSTEWNPLSGAPDHGGLHRGAHRDGAPPRPAPHYSDDVRHSRAPRCATPDAPHRTRATPLDRLCYRDVSPCHCRFRLASRSRSRGRVIKAPRL